MYANMAYAPSTASIIQLERGTNWISKLAPSY
jgi:hypothetical protein